MQYNGGIKEVHLTLILKNIENTFECTEKKIFRSSSADIGKIEH